MMMMMMKPHVHTTDSVKGPAASPAAHMEAILKFSTVIKCCKLFDSMRNVVNAASVTLLILHSVLNRKCFYFVKERKWHDVVFA